MPILYEFFLSHVRFHDYLTEISLCNNSDCVVCRKFGSGLRTPDTEIGRYTLLRPMDRPVPDPMNVGHFVTPTETAGFIARNRMSFEQLKAVLPKLDKDEFESDQKKADMEADTQAGGSDLFKGSKVRDIVKCNDCDFPRIIVSMNALKNRKPKLSRKQQKQLLAQLEAFKDNYVCGDACPVDGFETKRDLRCGDFVEIQYFTYARGSNDWPVDICCYCCNTEDLLTVDEMKVAYDTGGRQPLRLCTYCSSLNIEPPKTNASTSFIDKRAQQKTAKKQKRSNAVARGLKRAKK